MEYSVHQVASILNGEVIGDGTRKISNVGKIQEADENDIAFLSNPKYENFLYTTNAGAVLVRKDFEPQKEYKTVLIKVDDPYSSFTALLEQYYSAIKPKYEGIEKPSFLHDTCQYGNGLYVGAFSYLSENVILGNNVKIFPNVYVGPNVHIDDGTVLYSGVKIYSETKIGKNCVIHAGAVIGSDGFGFAPQADGTYKTIPQIGNVVIKDNVSVGSNTTIDRATMGSTIIENGVKLDNLIQIAHNVEVGKNTVMAAQTGIAGSVKIGENCIFAGQAGVVGHLTIGDRVTVASQTGLTKNLPKGNATILGKLPGLDNKKFARAAAVFKNLEVLEKRVRDLEEKIINLQANQEE